MTTLIIVQLSLMILGCLGILLYSLRYLSNPRAHGFYRFFGWLLTLFLVVMNLGYWFDDPLSTPQLISWVLLLISIVLALVGFFQLVKRGKPSGSFENTSTIVASGLYRYIRHPLYASLICFSWGAALKNPDLLSLICAAAATLFYFLTAKVEEEEMILKFKAGYRDYIKRTKMFIPFVF